MDLTDLLIAKTSAHGHPKQHPGGLHADFYDVAQIGSPIRYPAIRLQDTECISINYIDASSLRCRPRSPRRRSVRGPLAVGQAPHPREGRCLENTTTIC